MSIFCVHFVPMCASIPNILAPSLPKLHENYVRKVFKMMIFIPIILRESNMVSVVNILFVIVGASILVVVAHSLHKLLKK